MTAPIAQPGIMNIQPYVPGLSEVDGLADVVKISSNESAIGPSPKAVDAYLKMATELHRYPDGGSNRLRHGLAEFHDLNAENLVCGNGSDELIGQLIHAYAGPGDEVLYSKHGFLMYPLGALAAGATPVTADEDDYTCSVDAMLAAVNERTKLVFVANPNNPTGTYLPAPEIQRLQAGLPEHVVLVLDCAYAEFVNRNDYSPGIELVEGQQNVVMTRTFSKIYGLAALRVGWAYCPGEIAGVLNRFRGPFNVNMAAQAAGLAAIQDTGHIDRARVHNEQWMPWLTEELAKLGLSSTKSVGNFVTAEFADGPAALEYLAGKGVLARGIAPYNMPNHVRFTVGLEAENQRVVEVIKQFLSGSD